MVWKRTDRNWGSEIRDAGEQKMITIRRMKTSELARIGEIDRSERVTRAYVFRDGVLELEEVDWQVADWKSDGDDDHSVPGLIKTWRPVLEQGGVMFGALDGNALVGFALYRRGLNEDTDQLGLLHVTRDQRGTGIGSALMQSVIELARANGARKAVCVVDTIGAIGGVLSQPWLRADDRAGSRALRARTARHSHDQDPVICPGSNDLGTTCSPHVSRTGSGFSL